MRSSSVHGDPTGIAHFVPVVQNLDRPTPGNSGTMLNQALFLLTVEL